MASSNGKVSTVDSSHRRGEGWKTHQKLLMEVFLNELKASMMEEILCRGNDKFNGAVAQSEAAFAAGGEEVARWAEKPPPKKHYYGQEDVGKGKAPIKDVSPDLKDDDGNGLFTALPLWRELNACPGIPGMTGGRRGSTSTSSIRTSSSVSSSPTLLTPAETTDTPSPTTGPASVLTSFPSNKEAALNLAGKNEPIATVATTSPTSAKPLIPQSFINTIRSFFTYEALGTADVVDILRFAGAVIVGSIFAIEVKLAISVCSVSSAATIFAFLAICVVLKIALRVAHDKSLKQVLPMAERYGVAVLNITFMFVSVVTVLKAFL